MCWTYHTQTICKTCRAIQPGVCTLIEYCDPDCRKPCCEPWPAGKPEKNPQLGYVDSSQCSFCARSTEPGFLEEKVGQEDFVRGELERMRTLFNDRAEEKRKRREGRLKRKKKRARGESEELEVGGKEVDTTPEGNDEVIDEQESDEQQTDGQEIDKQAIDEQKADEQEADEQANDERESGEQEGDGERRTTRSMTRRRQRT